MTKRLLSLLTAIALLATIGACGLAEAAQENGKLDYINYDTSDYYHQWPIVNEGHDITLKFALVVDPSYVKAEDSFWFRFIEEVLNINTEIETVQIEAREQRLGLIFASNDLPDIFMGFPWTIDLLVKYGVNEGQLLDYMPYLDEYMPNVKEIFAAEPEVRTVSTAPNGEMYFVPRLREAIYPVENTNIRVEWLKALGLESPKTLDEFLDVMRAFKAADLDGIGSENVYPMGGAFMALNPFPTILNAMGYNCVYSWAQSKQLTECTLRDGEATVPCNDDIFYDFMKICKLCYDEGLVSPDFFTMDDTQANANASQGINGYVPQAMHVLFSEGDEFSKYYCMQPLTSEWNPEPQTRGGVRCLMSNLIVSAYDTEYPEVCARYVDFFFGPGGWLHARGNISSDISDEYANVVEGFAPYYMTVDMELGSNSGVYLGHENDGISYIYTAIMPLNLYYGETSNLAFNWGPWYVGYKDYVYKDTVLTKTADYYAERDQGSLYSQHGQRSMLMSFCESQYPNIVYRTEEEVSMLADLIAVIQPYVDEQFSLFVTGRRDLTEEEFAKYQEELRAIGAYEYEQFFIDEYNDYMSKQG